MRVRKGETPTFGIFAIRRIDIVGEPSVRQTDIRQTAKGEMTLDKPSLDKLMFSRGSNL